MVAELYREESSAAGMGEESRGSTGGMRVHVIVILGTLALLAGIVVGVVNFHRSQEEFHGRRALQIGEEGLMRALDSLQKNPSWRAGIARTSQRGGTYEVQVLEIDNQDPLALEIVAVGESGGVRRVQRCRMVLSVEAGDSVWTQAETIVEGQ